MVLSESPQSKQIDVVFNVYRDESIKNTARHKRNTGCSTQFKNICAGHKIQQWRKTVAVQSNKKPLFVTCKEQCYMVSCEAVQRRDDLKSSQEEAGTRVELYAHHAAREEYKSVVIVSE